MPTRHLISRYTCSAGNAFNPGAALLATFPTTPKRHISSRPLENAPRRREQSLIETEQLLQESAQPQNAQKERDTELINEDMGWFREGQSLHNSKQPLQSGPLRKIVPSSQLRFRKVGAAEASEEDEENSQNRRKQLDKTRAFRRLYEDQIQPMTDAQGRKLPFAQQAQTTAAQSTQSSPTLRSNAAMDHSSAQKGPGRKPKRITVAIKDSESEFFVDPLRTGITKNSWKSNQHDLARRAVEFSKQKVSPKDTAAIEERRRRMDYRALYVDTPNSPAAEPVPLPWRLDASDMAGREAMEILNLEIENFARYMDLTPMEAAARASVTEQVIEQIKSTAGTNVGIETFGSSELGLATILSDIDLRLWFYQSSKPPHPYNMKVKMEGIEYTLKNFNPDFILVSLRCSKYPIINAQHKQTGLDLQIVSAPDTNAQRQAMARYLQDIPHLRSVYMVLRMALGIRGLVDVFNGGIGSYGLFMMLVASLQRPSSKPPTTAGESLLRFLDFYSDLNTEKYGVSVSPPKLFKKHDVFTHPIKMRIDAARRRGDNIRAAQWAIAQTRIYQPYLFCLQDPADPLNDLGRKSNAIKHVQKTIRVLRASLQKSLQVEAPTAPRKPPWKEGSILLPLVGRCHEIYHDRRTRAEMQGRIAVQSAKGKVDRAAEAETGADVQSEGTTSLEAAEQKAAV
jgi:non-canonical poly(A) RNA polymerase PAPD5/7